jgi:hypothetical protein
MRTSILKIIISYIKEKKYSKALIMTLAGLGIGILIFLMALGVINILISKLSWENRKNITKIAKKTIKIDTFYHSYGENNRRWIYSFKENIF